MRIVPRQCPVQLSPAWGFLFEGRVMKWDTFEKAYIASYILRVHPGDIAPVQVLYPKLEACVES